EEYDPARPNDYEEYRREKKRKAREVEMMRELERRREEEEEREREREREREKERERERDRDQGDSRLNISDDCCSEDDGEDGVEGRARAWETGARDYYSVDGEENR
ncbi:DNA-damage-repair/toleration protein DRT111 chloroplastic-like, partial [Trifolium medium]|nr:DNA-damage-repair/toleration protein DRT111 chloroplastic-like [Trifolium medium]